MWGAHQNSLPFPKVEWFLGLGGPQSLINSSVKGVGEEDAPEKQRNGKSVAGKPCKDHTEMNERELRASPATGWIGVDLNWGLSLGKQSVFQGAGDKLREPVMGMSKV